MGKKVKLDNFRYKCLTCGIIYAHINPRTKYYEDELGRCFTCIEQERK